MNHSLAVSIAEFELDDIIAAYAEGNPDFVEVDDALTAFLDYVDTMVTGVKIHFIERTDADVIKIAATGTSQNIEHFEGTWFGQCHRAVVGHGLATSYAPRHAAE